VLRKRTRSCVTLFVSKSLFKEWTLDKEKVGETGVNVMQEE
jgi:hypothetical protein